MIVETTLAIISSIALTILLKRLKSFCDENNMSYEVMVRLNRYLTNRFFYCIIYIYMTCRIKMSILNVYLNLPGISY